MADIAQTLREASVQLAESGIEDPPRQAASLLALALQKDRAFLIAHPEYELTTEEESLFKGYLERRRKREPLQYIRGTQEFYGLDFEISPGVLIPRPETELLVENAIEILQAYGASTFCEVGVGSGCIFVSILHEVGPALATGLDISSKALRVAGINAKKHNVAARAELKISDVFDGLGAEKFDLIVSNPPYIPEAEFDVLQPEVRDFEPAGALTDGGTGLSVIERIVSDAPKFLKSGGFLLMEIGFGQAVTVVELFDTRIWGGVEILPDLQAIPRVVKARLAF
jgi:release factor glutamine methyltransferase